MQFQKNKNIKPQIAKFGVLCLKSTAFAIKLYIVAILLSTNGFSYGTFDFNTNVKDAYIDISRLKITAGQNKINKEKISNPSNLMPYFIENYVDFFVLFIQENHSEYKSRLKNRNIRLEKLKSGDPASPYYLFCQAEVILQWATIKLKFNDKFGAAKDVYEAYNILERNKELFPNFKENDKSLSIIHALAESLPSLVRKTLGIKGSISLATKEITELTNYVAKTNHIFKDEVVAIHSYILFYSNNKKEEAFALFGVHNMDYTKSPLIAFLMATMAQKNGKNDLAIKILEQRPKSSEYMPFYYLDFMYGKFKLFRLDTDAESYILKFVQNFKGQHYIKEAYQKLAWSRLILKNDQAGYSNYLNQVKTKGKKLIDEDKQAFLESSHQIIPDKILLKSRLLYDGGYYSKAQQLLILHSDNFSKRDLTTKCEFNYRMGRINDALKNYHDAMDYYATAIKQGDSMTYFACASALYLGIIYENLRNYTMAKENYNLCLNFDPDGYATSLHQKASSGLERIKSRN
ncbi:MAG: hypothetical protein R2774_06625 [Saprospiraceae bacterium]